MKTARLQHFASRWQRSALPGQSPARAKREDSPAPRRRRATALTEVLAGAALLAVASTITLQALGGLSLQRRAVDQRYLALLEAANCLERLAAQQVPLDSAVLARQELSPEAARQLTDGKLQVWLEPVEQSAPGPRVVVEVAWRERHGRPARPVRLVAWLGDLSGTERTEASRGDRAVEPQPSPAQAAEEKL